MASLIYAGFWDALAAGGLRMTQDRFRGLLVTADYVPDQLRHAVRADVAGEVAGPGYQAGGLPLLVSTQRQGAGLRFSFGEQIWRAASIKAARGQVVYRAGENGAPDILLFFNDFGEDVTSTADDFTVGACSIAIGG
jgi:hypothetical protein